jgi:hypothetical protein
VSATPAGPPTSPRSASGCGAAISASRTLADAFEGATQVLIVSANELGEKAVGAHAAAIDAARAAGAERILYTTHQGAGADSFVAPADGPVSWTTPSDLADEWAAGLAAHGAPEALATMMLGMFRAAWRGEFSATSPALGDLLGRPATALSSFLEGVAAAT